MCGVLALFRHDSTEVTVNSPQMFTRRLHDEAYFNSLNHRGPDQTIRAESFVDGWCAAIGQSTLRVSDPDSEYCGVFETDRYQMVCNGEIYNAGDLRAELKTAGVNFRTEIDTEVLLQCWNLWQESCLSRLEGMFAFILYDKERNQVSLARDRFGEKPLYLFALSKTLAIASEMKSFLYLPPPERPSIDFDFLAYATDPINTSFTPLTNVSNIARGEIVTVKLLKSGAKVSRKSWIDSQTSTIQRHRPHKLSSGADLVDDLEKALENSLSIRTPDGVPWVAELSGGVDSSLVASLLATGLYRAESSKPSRQLFRGFVGSVMREDSQDAVRALRVAKELDVPFEQLVIRPEEISARDLVGCVWALEDPHLGDLHLVLYKYYESLHNRSIKVSFSGNGADELFFGYLTMYLSLLSALKERGTLSAAKAKKSERELVGVFKTSFPDLTRSGRLLGELVTAGEYYQWKSPRRRVALWILGYSALAPISCLNVLKRPGTRMRRMIVRWAVAANSARLKQKISGRRRTLGQKASFLRSYFLMITPMGRHLRFIDRLSAAHGVEVRQPYLDSNVVALAMSIPFEGCVAEGWTKMPLRKLLKKYLPESLALQTNKLGWADEAEGLFVKSESARNLVINLVMNEEFDHVATQMGKRRKTVERSLQELKTSVLKRDWEHVGRQMYLINLLIYIGLFSTNQHSRFLYSQLMSQSPGRESRRQNPDS